ncbi:hypothetical protein KM043_001750 [Ampulex compressa]|nr:hypothetical protein KM043_001750 [Ampulex compressa]
MSSSSFQGHSTSASISDFSVYLASGTGRRAAASSTRGFSFSLEIHLEGNQRNRFRPFPPGGAPRDPVWPPRIFGIYPERLERSVDPLERAALLREPYRPIRVVRFPPLLEGSFGKRRGAGVRSGPERGTAAEAESAQGLATRIDAPGLGDDEGASAGRTSSRKIGRLPPPVAGYID